MNTSQWWIDNDGKLYDENDKEIKWTSLPRNLIVPLQEEICERMARAEFERKNKERTEV